MSGKNKGSQFERDICRTLSLWWSEGKDDDIFWRTASSGGRASQRRKKNKLTFGQSGDIQATNPIGQPLIDVCTIELKRGYSKATIFDLIDKPKAASKQMYESFFEQALIDNVNSGSWSWMLITRRDRREPIVFIPPGFKDILESEYCYFPRPYLRLYCRCCKGVISQIFAIPLSSFLQMVKPKHIRVIHDKIKT